MRAASEEAARYGLGLHERACCRLAALTAWRSVVKACGCWNGIRVRYAAGEPRIATVPRDSAAGTEPEATDELVKALVVEKPPNKRGVKLVAYQLLLGTEVLADQEDFDRCGFAISASHFRFMGLVYLYLSILAHLADLYFVEIQTRSP